MSRQASQYLAQNLYEIRRATYTEGDKVRPLGSDGLALLVYLCDATGKHGTFFMTAETMREETGIATVRLVRRLLAGLEQMGYITRTGALISYEGRGKPTPEYALTLVPGLWTKHENDRSGVPQGTELVSHGTLENRRKPNTGNKSAGISFSEPEPQPQPKPQPGQVEGDQNGGRLERLIDLCSEREKQGMKGKKPGIGLYKHWRVEYTPICQQVMRDCPGYTDSQLMERAWNIRNGIEVKPPAPRIDPDCSVCRGQGWYLYQGQDWQGKAFCPCTGDPRSVAPPTDTQEDTHKRVTPDQAPNTDPPAPGTTADPGSDPVSDLAKRLRRVV